MISTFRKFLNPRTVSGFRPMQYNNKICRMGFCSQKDGGNQEHKDAFNKLKDKIDSDKTDSSIKTKYYTDMLKNAKDQLADKVNKIDINKIQDNIKTKLKQQPETKPGQEGAAKKEGEEKEEEQQYTDTYNPEQEKREEDLEKKESFYEKISKKEDHLSKAMKFGVDAWRQTFPNDEYIAKQKMEKAREAAKKLKEMEEQIANYTEEELEAFQEKVPEWKKTSLQTVEQKEEKIKLKDKLKGQVKAKFNRTEFAQNLYKSEEYKEYTEFKTEMAQFKEDAKDHLHNSPSNVVQGGLFIYEKASTENQVARSIREMRKHDPEFDLWELEKETKVIFESAYNAFLSGEVALLEKFCGEQALGYFKALIKKREAENATPKYKQLWSIDRAQFAKAYMPDAILPVFVFDINVQEIYCNLCNKTGKIIDGSDDRVMRYAYMFAIRLHLEPDLETVGHKWELVEVQPKEVVKLLV